MQINPLCDEIGGGTQWFVVNANLKYRIVSGIVFVHVTTDTTSSWNSIGFIPSSVAPTAGVYQSLYSDPSNFVSVTVEATGNVLCFSSVSVSGVISYPLG